MFLRALIDRPNRGFPNLAVLKSIDNISLKLCFRGINR